MKEYSLMADTASSRTEQLAARLYRLMSLYGYERLETPVLQNADLFLTRAGDQIITRLFTFEHNGASIALRPEFTSSAMHRYIGEGRHTPARWQFGGYVFEAEDELANAQHFSLGAEAIGLPSGLADAEILALAVRGLRDSGMEEVTLHVGHVAFLRARLSRHVGDARLQRFLLNQAHALRLPGGEATVRAQMARLLGREAQDGVLGASPSPSVIDALLRPLEQAQLMGGRSREDIQRRLLVKLERAEAAPAMDAGLAELQQMIALEGAYSDVLTTLRRQCADDATALTLLDSWGDILAQCVELGVPPDRIVLTPALSRNWDYYSGLVFELHSRDRHVGGGGRYDDLARLLGADAPVPAVGFAYYVDEVLAALPDEAAGPRVWSLGTVTVNRAVARWLEVLRRGGIAVRVQSDPGDLVVSEAGNLTVGGRSFTPDAVDDAVRWLKEHV
jgi:histidyl-tRNA synthetase